MRGIGVHGWDGTKEGRGEFESEEALKGLFSFADIVVAVTIRHRVDMEGMYSKGYLSQSHQCVSMYMYVHGLIGAIELTSTPDHCVP